MNTPTVLLYNLDTPKGRQVKLLCLTMKFRVRTVVPREYGQTLKALMGREPAAEEYGGPGFPEEMLVMADFSNAQMNAFLQGFRRKKIPSVALKAMLTPTNSQWDSLQLHAELLQEHEAMLRGESAHEGG